VSRPTRAPEAGRPTRTPRAPRPLVALGGLAWLGLALAPVTGWTHAMLVKSIPARRAVLLKAPDRVQLWFSERLEPQFATLSVWDAAGARVDAGDAAVGTDDPKRLAVGLRPLAPGAYTVKFRVLSVDGHVVESEFGFRLRPSP
jgi:copper resistance protein C